MTTLNELTAGMPILVGGDRVTYVTPELASAFRPGDRLLVAEATGDLLHVPAAEARIAAEAVGRAYAAYAAMGAVPDAMITAFYEAFARRLEDDASWGQIQQANVEDVERARAKGQSTTRLQAGDKMRRDMIAGLREWRDAPSRRNVVQETVTHAGWRVEQMIAPLGVVGFVFEGRPNVFADATGVLRSGNSAVLRIGSGALGTARAIVRHALESRPSRKPACRPGRSCWWTAPRMPPAGRCSATAGWRWR